MNTPGHELDKRRLRADLVVRLAVVFVALFVSVLLATLSILTVQARQDIVSNGELSEEVLKTQELLIDCTTPPGECYRRGEQRTAEAVFGINEGNLLAVAAVLSCQERGHVGAKKILACADRVIARLQASR